MAKKAKDFLGAFFRGVTFFHIVGLALMIFGSYLGDAPEAVVNKTKKLMTDVRHASKECEAQKITVNSEEKKCSVHIADIRGLRAAITSLSTELEKITGERIDFDVAGFKGRFTITLAQVVGLLVFLYELIKSKWGKKPAGKILSARA